ncbi:MAG: CDP-alcohol phosphatidyltransferase family protein [Pseudomonadota bacterium]
MPTIYDLKPRFQALLRPFVKILVDAEVTANQITWTGLVVSALAGLLIWITDGHWATLLLLPEILFIRMALNAIDGMMAREHGQATTAGAFLNELSDVAADAVLYMPIAVVAGVSPVLVGLVVAGGALVEMAGVLAHLTNSDRRYDGPFGKSDRAVFWGGLAVLLALGLGGWWVNWVLGVAVALSAWTTYRRCRKAMEAGDAGAA